MPVKVKEMGFCSDLQRATYSGSQMVIYSVILMEKQMEI
jgi:hypothetical protein